MERVYNFAAGPSTMPIEVLEEAQKDLLNYKGCGMSVMEMSHRSAIYKEIFLEAKEGFKKILNVPDSHEVLFLQGGATLQFASIPMNLLEGKNADYAVTGHFSRKAAKEAEKYGTVNIIYDGLTIPKQENLKFTEDAKYFYYCANNTIFGTEWNYVPECPSLLVSDMSSDILSKPVDVSKFALIYAGAQKNIAPAGLTVVIIDKSIAGHEIETTPQVMSYKVQIENDSMLNTPPCWCIYMLGLTVKWLEKQGGLEGMEKLKKERAGLLYTYLDESKLFIPSADIESRSDMNVTFRTASEEIDAEFIKGAAERGLVNIKGHKITGGMRASLYNAMPVEGVKKLIEYMKEFETRCIK